MMERPVRGCEVCGQEDDHPRHVVQLTPETLQVRHMDCCASQGCGTCAETEQANGELRGQQLIDHLDATRTG